MSGKTHFNPFISTPGVKMDVNTVNILNLTPSFPPQAQNNLIWGAN